MFEAQYNELALAVDLIASASARWIFLHRARTKNTPHFLRLKKPKPHLKPQK
jgi:hypothetical protein